MNNVHILKGGSVTLKAENIIDLIDSLSIHERDRLCRALVNAGDSLNVIEPNLPTYAMDMMLYGASEELEE